MTGMTIHVDCDIVAYRAASATDGKRYLYLGDRYETIKEMVQIHGSSFNREAVEVTYTPEPFSHAKKIVDNILEEYPFGRCYIGSKANFRYKVATIKDYKGNRRDTRKPHHLTSIRQYIVDEYEGVLPGGPYETDDTISLSIEEGDTLVTIDKDFLQLPNIKLKDMVNGKVTETTEVSALRSLYTQVLTGDTADNIPGCYNCGPKAVSVKLVNTLETEEEMFDVVMKEYKKRYHNYAEQFMTENLKLLYLLRRTQLAWVAWLGCTKFYEEIVQ